MDAFGERAYELAGCLPAASVARLGGLFFKTSPLLNSSLFHLAKRQASAILHVLLDEAAIFKAYRRREAQTVVQVSA